MLESALKHYPLEFKADAVALYRSRSGVTIKSVAEDLGVNTETLRNWIRAADGRRRGLTRRPRHFTSNADSVEAELAAARKQPGGQPGASGKARGMTEPGSSAQITVASGGGPHAETDDPGPSGENLKPRLVVQVRTPAHALGQQDPADLRPAHPDAFGPCDGGQRVQGPLLRHCHTGLPQLTDPTVGILYSVDGWATDFSGVVSRWLTGGGRRGTPEL